MNGAAEFLDPRTMYVAMAAANLTMSIALVVANVRGAHLRAMSIWVAATFALFLGLTLYALRDFIAPELSVLVANSAVLLALALEVAALIEFSGRRVAWGTLIGLFVLCALLHVALYYIDPSMPRWRVAATSLTFGAWQAAAAVVLLSTARGYERASHWLTALFFVVWSAFNVIRGTNAAVSDDPSLALFGQGSLETIWLAINFISMLGTSLGFILMTKERADHEIIRIASVDALTGLWNRRTFNAAAQMELERAGRDGHPLSVLMIDLDHFKRINDTYGHPAGDAILEDFAALLDDAVRPFDISSRYGGEEFAVLLIGTSIDEARAIAERVRHGAGERRIAAGKELVTYTVSVGVAQVSPYAGSIDETVSQADAALYRAKQSGRNRVEVHEVTLTLH